MTRIYTDSFCSNNTQCEPERLILREDSPLYADMLELARRGREGKIKLFTHEQVWEQEAEQ